MRVAQVIEAAGAGVGRHTIDLTSQLHRRGIDVHLFYSCVRVEQWLLNELCTAEFAQDVVPIYRQIGWRDLASVIGLRQMLKKRGPFDIIHGQSSKGGAVARIAACGTRAGRIYTPHALASMDPTGSVAKRFIFGRIESALARVTDAIICVSPEEREFAQSAGIPSDKLHVVPNTIGKIAFPDRHISRRGLGLTGSELVIGFVGRMSRQKAPDVLLNAFAELKDSFPRAVLVMVGDGDLLESMKQMGQRLGVAERIRWLGHTDGRSIMPTFDVLAIPSRYEGLPYVGLEALAAGLPIVATAAAGCRLIVKMGENGIVVPRDDHHAFAAALGSVLESKSRREAWSAASRKASEQFTLDSMVDGTIAVYERVLGRAVARPLAN